MENSSSSSSAREEASMDDSEPEPEYDYDLDDADDGPHDDFDELHDDDDDDDDDEDDLEPYIRAVGHQEYHYIQPTAIEIPLLSRPEPFVQALPLRARNSQNGFHFDNLIPLEPPVLAIPYLRDESIRNAFMDTFESTHPSHNTRLLEHIETIRMDGHNNHFSSRSRPTAIPVVAPRWPRLSDNSHGTHPLLYPPRRPSTATNSSSFSLSLLSSLARRAAVPAAIVERPPLGTNTAANPHVRAMDSIVRVVPPVMSPQSDSSSVASSSSEPPLAQRQRTSPPFVPRPDHTSSSIPRARDGQPLTHLFNANLMRSVAIPPRSEAPLAAFSRSRSHHDRAASRDRDRDRDRDRERDKVPTHIARRWTYEPPLSGGDSLPPLFDAEACARSSRAAMRHGGNQNQVHSEPSKSLQKSASKVCTRIMSMLTSQRRADQKVVEEEKKLERQKKLEEEAKAKAEAADEVTSKDTSGGKDTATPEVRAEKTMHQSTLEMSDEHGRTHGSAENPSIENGTATAIETRGSAEDTSPDSNLPTNPENGDENNSNAQIDASSDIVNENADEVVDDRPDAEMQSPEAAMVGNRDANDPSGEPTGGEGAGASDSPEGPERIVFSAVATERAAAAGISLDAPANENPEVVAAATQSTGIDPAFLAALPEEMRTEILTQYYEQIRTNTDGQGESSDAPATTVNQDFLIALPPALRAEVLELEAQFQARQEQPQASSGSNANANTAASGGGPGIGAEMDNASFLATLAPDLREEILLTSGEAFIQSLPPNVAAEARVLQERNMQRVPWRVARADGTIGHDARLLSQGIRGANLGRRDSRSQPREPPVYRWQKTSEGWLRKRPNVEDEPESYMKPEGLSALVELLWYRHPSVDDNLLYQVFSYVCKTTESRYVILDDLVRLVTSNSIIESPKATSESTKEDSTRQHGAAVLRSLKILTTLCKNDAVVAETLLGLPKTEQELDSGNDNSTAAKAKDNYSQCSLSTLVSMLAAPLFKRSSSHLSLLVTLISAVSHSIPSNEPNPSASSRSRSRASHRSRAFVDRSTLAHPMADPINMLMQSGDEDEPGMFDIRDEEQDESIEADDLFDPIPNQARHGRQGAEDASNLKKKDSPAEERVPVQYRVPVLKEQELTELTRVLLRPGCGERTYDKTTRSIGLLGEHPTNRTTFVTSLISIATETGLAIQRDYSNCMGSLNGTGMVDKTRKEKSVVESPFFMATASSELTFLRVVKSLSALLKHSSSPKESGEDFTKTLERTDDVQWSCMFKECVTDNLKDLWASLDRLLGLIAEEDRSKDKRENKESKVKTTASSVLNPDRMKNASRGLSPTLARLSPMIEAFLVAHAIDWTHESEEQKSHKTVGSPTLSVDSGSSKRSGITYSAGKDEDRGLDDRLAVFVERHRDPINSLLRANPALLETSFKGALRHPHAIDFDNKKAYFRNVIRRRSSEVHAGTIRINVRRDRVFDDSYQQLRLRTPDQMKGRLHVQFTGEEGVDAGGVTREWYTILARQIFNPNYVLFTRSAAKAATYQPDKRSYINREHLENFRFVGRIIGKAIYDGQLLDAYFTRSFYKHILGLKPTYHDIEAQDPDYYKSLKWMLENSIDGILEYTMSAEYDEFGKQTVLDLLPNGRNVPVTEDNKADYVRLVTEVRMTKSIEKQIEAFKEGFNELIPHEDCKIFNELELELLMSGLPDIDVSDLKANVEYTGYTASSPQINWFWRCVGKMDQEDLARLVMFVTGTSKVPLEGFSQLQGMNGVQKFQIHRVGGNTMRLPSAHTCFNQLDLPEYSTAEILSERLLRAVRECSVGFGFA